MDENLIKHKIKIPIFSSEIIESEPGELFERPNYESMINYLKQKIDSFNIDKPIIKHSKTNKVKETQISSIEYFDSSYEGVPTILLRITAFNTNLIDGFVEIEEKINFEKNHKIGSETNYLLIYPQIFGNVSSTFKYQWKFFIYDDPTKESSDIISICKLTGKKILGVKIRNLKLENILKEIKENKILENIEVQLSSHYSDIEDPEIKLKNYIVTSKVSKITKNSYKDVPTEKFEEILNTVSNYSKRVFKIFKRNREIRITEEYKNDLKKVSQTIEEIFNSEIEFDENDLNQLFNIDFIIQNLNSVITDFIRQNN